MIALSGCVIKIVIVGTWLGVIRVLPYSYHLLVDFLVGVVFLLAPTVLGFDRLDAWYYWANGAAVMLVVGLNKPECSSSDVLATD